jgi:hypothetical protein
MTTEISGKECVRLFTFMKPKYKSCVPKFEKAYLCLTALSGNVLDDTIPGNESIIKEIKPIIPEEPNIGQGISSVNEGKLAKLLEKYNKQFGEQAPIAENRPTATTSCIQTDPDDSKPNKPLRTYNPGEIWRLKLRLIKCFNRRLLGPVLHRMDLLF